MSNLSKEPYKGVRDFYPEDMYVQKYMFSIMSDVVEKYGYTEYNASILEPAELYKAKTGEEIVNEQTYTFKDRGERDVTLRPEMTPTVARMIAARRRDLAFPVRWYSIPNLFRYERPQRGRLREHWQLNVDIFGSTSIFAEVEIIDIAYNLMTRFGVTPEKFVIKINNRSLMNLIFNEILELPEEESHRLSKVIDKKEKIEEEDFNEQIKLLLGEKSSFLLNILNARDISSLRSALPENLSNHESIDTIENVLHELSALGITNAILDTSLMRGFDYYTGIVFEVFDTNPENRRSLFGGGRYDNLLEIFNEEKVPAVGFGMGDVTLRDVLETYDLLPSYTTTTDLYICTLSSEYIKPAELLAQELRKTGLSVAVDLTDKKVGNQISTADKLNIPYILVVGENEVNSNRYTVKKLETGEEKVLNKEEIPVFISNS